LFFVACPSQYCRPGGGAVGLTHPQVVVPVLLLLSPDKCDQ